MKNPRKLPNREKEETPNRERENVCFVVLSRLSLLRTGHGFPCFFRLWHLDAAKVVVQVLYDLLTSIHSCNDRRGIIPGGF